MKTFLLCLLTEVVTVFPYHRYNPYNSWIVQHHLPLYSYNHRINVIGTENLSDQRNNIGVSKTKNNIGISGTHNQDNKKILIEDVHLNLGRKISNIDNKSKTQKEENNINTNVNIHNGNQISNSASYEDNILGGYSKNLNSMKGTGHENSYISYIPEYSSGYYSQYNQERNPSKNSYSDNNRGRYNSFGPVDMYNSNEAEEETSVSNKYVENNSKKTQDENTDSNSQYQIYDSNMNAEDLSNTNKHTNDEGNKVNQNITGIINVVEDDSNQSTSIPVNEEENQGYYIEKSEIDTDNTETEDNSSESLVGPETITPNKIAPCLLSLSLTKPMEIIKTNKIEIRQKETLNDSILSSDVDPNIKGISIGRKEHCLQKCLNSYG